MGPAAHRPGHGAGSPGPVPRGREEPGPRPGVGAPRRRPAAPPRVGLHGLAVVARPALGAGGPRPHGREAPPLPRPHRRGDAPRPAPVRRDPAARVREGRLLRRRRRGGAAPGPAGGVPRGHDLLLRAAQPVAEAARREPEPRHPALAPAEDESPRPRGRGLESDRGTPEQPPSEITRVPYAERGACSTPGGWCIEGA